MAHQSERFVMVIEPERLSDFNFDRYMTSLGWFVWKFSSVENSLKWTAAIASGVSADLVDVLFGGMSLASSIDLLRKLQRAGAFPSEAELPEVGRALRHLKGISEFRNKVLHHGVWISERGMRTNPTLRAKPPTGADAS